MQEGEIGGDWAGDGGPAQPTIFANCATCGWETLTMLNPQLVAGKHGFLGSMSPKTFGLFEFIFLFV